MMHIYEFLGNTMHLTDKTLIQKIIDVSENYVVPKGEYIYFQGEPIVRVVFLIKGITRGFVIDLEGHDVTECLCHVSGSCVMPDSYLNPVALAYIEALTECEVFAIPFTEINTLMNEHMSIMQMYNHMLLSSADYHRKLKTVIYQYSAIQRYQWFLETYPDLIDVVPNKYVASLLNMSPVTLSRLRRVLREEQEPETNKG